MTQINPSPDRGRGNTAKSLRGISKGTREFFEKDRTRSRPNPKKKFKKRSGKRR